MKVNGTLINYYFHCKRQCYLHGNRLNLEDNSELVKIGKAIHEEKTSQIYAEGDRVCHPKFGEGTVVSAGGKIVSVDFDSEGIKKLAADIAPLEKR